MVSRVASILAPNHQTKGQIMCGIFGFVSKKDNEVARKLTPILAREMAERGIGSWGVTDGTTIYKVPDSILESFVETNLTSPCYHTRAPSVGAVSHRNAHPFEKIFNNYRVIGVHNGHISNYSDLKQKYPHRADHEVDSEHIFSTIAEGTPVKELSGWGTVVWWEGPTDEWTTKARQFISTFNSNALAIAKLASGDIVYASTKKAISIACCLTEQPIEHFYEIKPKAKYEIRPHPEHGLTPFIIEELPWGEAPVHNIVYNSFRGTNKLDTSLQCRFTQCWNKLKNPRHIVCPSCLDRKRREIQQAIMVG